MPGERFPLTYGQDFMDIRRDTTPSRRNLARTGNRLPTRIGLAAILFASGVFAGVVLRDLGVIRERVAAAMGSGVPAVLFVLALLASAGTGCAVLLYFLRPAKRLREARADMARLAVTDGLTGLYNRRSFFVRLEEEIDRVHRYGTNLSMIMFDIDDFGRINETHGHPVGDAALAEVARLLSANARASDILARYGGEEFVMLVPSMGLEEATRAAEKLRIVVEVNDLVLEGPEVKVTISAGVADAATVAEGDGPLKDRLVKAAHNALRRAKAKGRNRVEAHRKSRSKQLNLV
jgi:diguanylate cyclase (GGDEF)-like protein